MGEIATEALLLVSHSCRIRNTDEEEQS